MENTTNKDTELKDVEQIDTQDSVKTVTVEEMQMKLRYCNRKVKRI